MKSTVKPADAQPGAMSVSAGPGLEQRTPEQRLAILRSLKDSGKTLALRTAGMSMQPLIAADAVAEITFMPLTDVRPGDIILFHNNDATVLHRVMAVRRDGDQVRLVEKGDHQPFSSTITGDRYLGVMTGLKTGDRRVRRDTATGRMQARVFLLVGRFEMLLYAAKIRMWGREPTRTGRWLSRALLSLRRAVLRVAPGHGRKGGGN